MNHRALLLAKTLFIVCVTCVAGIALSCCGVRASDEDTRAAESLSTGAGTVNGASNPFIYTYLGNDQRRFYGRAILPPKLERISRFYIGGGVTYTSRTGFLRWRGTGFTGQPVIYSDQGREYLIIGSYDHTLKKLDLNAFENDAPAKKVLMWQYQFPDIVKGSPSMYFDKASGRYVVLMGARYGKQPGNGVDLGNKYIWSYRAIDAGTGQEIWRMNSSRTHSYSRDNDGTGLFLPDRGMLFNASENAIGYFINSDSRDVGEVPRSQIPYREELTPGRRFFRPRIFATRRLYRLSDYKHHGGELATEGSPARMGNYIYTAASGGRIWGMKIPEKNDPSGTGFEDPVTDRVPYAEWDFHVGSDMNGTIVVSKEQRLYVTIERQYIKGYGGVYKLNPLRPADPAQAVDWYFPIVEPKTDSHALLGGGIIGSVAINDEYFSKEKVPLVATNTMKGTFYLLSQTTLEKKQVWGPNEAHKHATPRIVFEKFIGGTLSTPIFSDGNLLITSGGGGIYIFKLSYERTTDTDPRGVRNVDGIPYRVSVNLQQHLTGGGTFEATPVVWKDKLIWACRDEYLYIFGQKPVPAKSP